MAPRYARGFLLAALLAAGPLAETAAGQLPAARLYSIFPPGGRRGENVEVVIGGADLEGVHTLRFSHAGLRAVAKRKEKRPPSGKTKRTGTAEFVPNTFIVSIGADVPPGVYEARAVGAYGVSTPQAFVVGVRPEVREVESNDDRARAQPVEVGQVVNARSDREGDVDFFRFDARQGERVLIECDAVRIDSQFRPVMTLYDDAGTVLRTYHQTTFEPLLDFEAPRDGTYFLEMHDATYGRAKIGGPRGHHVYRLTIHRGPHIDFVFPPAGPRGGRATFALYGRGLPGGKPDQAVVVDGRPLERLDVEIALPEKTPASSGSIEIFEQQRLGSLVAAPSASLEGFLYAYSCRLSGTDEFAVCSIFLGFATADVVVEREPNDRPDRAQRLVPPCEVAGRFAPVGDRDWFLFEAEKGEVYEIEVLAQRLGVATDPLLVVQQVKSDGAVVELASVDDQRLSGVASGPLKNNGRYAFNTNTDDPAYRFTAPADGTYRLMVRDLYHELRGDPRFIYRLSIRHPRPDFRLAAVAHYPQDLGPQNRNCEPWSLLLRRGGTERIDVLGFRWDGFEGDIEVRVEGLPEGVTCRGTILRPGQTSAALILRAAENAPAWNGPIRIVGRARIGDRTVERVAADTTVVILGRTARFEPQSRRALATYLSVSTEPAPVLVEIGDGTDLEVRPGETIQVPVKVLRRGAFQGPVQLIPVVSPDKVTSKVVTIAAGKSSGEVPLTIGKSAVAGPHRVAWEAKIDVPYRRVGAPAKSPARKLSARIPTTALPIRVAPKGRAGSGS